MDFKYFIYRIFETKWKRACWNVAQRHMAEANDALRSKVGEEQIEEFNYHYTRALKAMDLIL